MIGHNSHEFVAIHGERTCARGPRIHFCGLFSWRPVSHGIPNLSWFVTPSGHEDHQAKWKHVASPCITNRTRRPQHAQANTWTGSGLREWKRRHAPHPWVWPSSNVSRLIVDCYKLEIFVNLMNAASVMDPEMLEQHECRIVRESRWWDMSQWCLRNRWCAGVEFGSQVKARKEPSQHTKQKQKFKRWKQDACCDHHLICDLYLFMFDDLLWTHDLPEDSQLQGQQQNSQLDSPTNAPASWCQKRELPFAHMNVHDIHSSSCSSKPLVSKYSSILTVLICTSMFLLGLWAELRENGSGACSWVVLRICWS